jgi:hypothetical protein
MTMASDTPSNHVTPSLSSTSIEENNSALISNLVTLCLDTLKIDDSALRKKALDFAGSLSAETINAYGNWTAAVKAIADACAVNSILFSQSEMCDFLTVAVKEISSKKVADKKAHDATFHIYMDIMENYQAADYNLKEHYPRLIIDVISALDKGIDSQGKSVGIYSIDKYYQERKTTIVQEDPAAKYSSDSINKRRRQHRERQHSQPFSSNEINQSYNDEIVENLMHMTSRLRKDLEQSISNLHPVDAKKIADLSINYDRLEKYNKLVSNPDTFKIDLEKELGRNLTDNQLQHAINSVRKYKIYIENILDGKFAPHGTHGINHVKHNLEYGYQLMGLMEPRKRQAN